MELMRSDSSLTIEAERQIIAFKEAMEAIENKQNEFKKQLIEEMKRRGITSYKDENITITLIPEGKQKKFDSKAFKKQFPSMYEKFAKVSKVSGYVKVSVKKGITSENMKEDVVPEIEGIRVINSDEIETF